MFRVLLDANLIVLFIVGSIGRDRIARHRRLSAFDGQDFDLLVEIVGGYDRIVVTPNVLTEASNLLRSGGAWGASALDAARGLAALALAGEERFAPSREVVQEHEFARLGLADVASLLACDPRSTLLTTDAGLYVAAARRNLKAINFNHLRDR